LGDPPPRSSHFIMEPAEWPYLRVNTVDREVYTVCIYMFETTPPPRCFRTGGRRIHTHDYMLKIFQNRSETYTTVHTRTRTLQIRNQAS